MQLDEIKRGDTRVYPFRMRKDGAYLDLTGGKVFFTVKLESDDPDESAIISKVVECTGTSTAIILTHNDTKDLEERTYCCDFQYVSADSSFVCTELASLKVIKDVTHRITAE